MKNRLWFTLIEIMVVVTIILILSTIWAVSYTKLIKTSKDSSNLSFLNELSNWLNAYKISNNSLPLPDNYNKVFAWTWNIDSYQWFFWKKAMEKSSISANIEDFPIYRVSSNLKAFDLFYKTKQRKKDNLLSWDNIWIIFQGSNNINWDVDLLSKDTSNLRVYFHNWDILNWQNDNLNSKYSLAKAVFNSNCYSLYRLFWYNEDWFYKVNSAWNFIEKFCPMSYFSKNQVFSYFSFDNWEFYDEVWNYFLTTQNYINRSSNTAFFTNTRDISTGSFANLSLDVKVFDEEKVRKRDNSFDEASVCFWSSSDFSSTQKWLEISFYNSKAYTWKTIDFSHSLANSGLQEFWKVFYDYTATDSWNDLREPSWVLVSNPSSLNFYCWVFSDNNVKIYLNWDESFSKNTNANFKSSDKFLWNIAFFAIPSTFTSTDDYTFDELIILKKALSNQEIKTFYNNQK